MRIVLEKIGVVAIVLLLSYSLVVNFIQNSNTGVIGYDEGIYIVNAMGHYEDTPITDSIGSWVDAIEKGMKRTGDPAGSFLILHFWEKVSMSEQWLRLLPFVFFIIGIAVIIRIGLMAGVPLIISVAMGYLPLASAQSVYHSIELRAYAIELGVTYLAIYSCIRLFISISNNNLNNIREWILFTVICLIGLLTRWSFMITISACYSSVFLYSLYHKRSLRHNINIKQLLVSAFIVYSAFVFVYLMVFGEAYGTNFQFLSDPSLIKLNISEYIESEQSIFYLFSRVISLIFTYPGIFYQTWVNQIIALYSFVFLLLVYYVMTYIKLRCITAIQKNLSNKFFILIGSIAIVIPFIINPETLSFMLKNSAVLKPEYTILFWLLDLSLIVTGFVFVRKIGETTSERIKAVNSNNYSPVYLALFVIPISAIFISILLAYLNLYPFSPRNRVSLFLDAHYNMLIIGLIAFIVYNRNWRFKFFFGTGVVVLAVTHGFLFSQHDNIYRGGGAQHTTVLVSEFLSDDEINKVDYWFISSGESNSFKYHVMFGGLKDKISEDAEIIIENRSSDIKSQLEAINVYSKSGDRIVMITGHAGENDVKYQLPFEEVFNDVIVSKFIQSSMLGELSEGGEQVYYGRMDN
jgi:hypothetical protein